MKSTRYIPCRQNEYANASYSVQDTQMLIRKSVKRYEIRGCRFDRLAMKIQRMIQYLTSEWTLSSMLSFYMIIQQTLAFETSIASGTFMPFIVEMCGSLMRH